MIPFFVADLVVKNPCANIDPDSWAWIFSGCWIFSLWPAFLSLALALMLARLVKSLRREGQTA